MVRYVVIASIPRQRFGKVIYSGSSKAVWLGRRYGKW